MLVEIIDLYLKVMSFSHNITNGWYQFDLGDNIVVSCLVLLCRAFDMISEYWKNIIFLGV